MAALISALMVQCHSVENTLVYAKMHTAAPSLTCESHLHIFLDLFQFQCSSTIQLSIKSSVNLK